MVFAAVSVLATDGTSPSSGATASSDAAGALTSYTFRVAVEMSMRHFPWLRFHVDGVGRYERDKEYNVTFTHVPALFPHVEALDLSPLDESRWPKTFTVTPLGTTGADSIFRLTPLQANSTLTSAIADVNPLFGVETVAFDYADGTHIRLNLTAKDIAGYLLPASGTADIDMPHMPMVAQATFFDYTFSTSSL